jgi:hypothetical protein
VLRGKSGVLYAGISDEALWGNKLRGGGREEKSEKREEVRVRMPCLDGASDTATDFSSQLPCFARVQARPGIFLP